VNPRPAFIGVSAGIAMWLTPGCATSTPEPAEPAVREAVVIRRVPDGAPVYDLARLDAQPVPVFQARPRYPAELRNRGINGEAVVDFVIGPDGDVYRPHSVRETHPDFGAAAVEAVANWKFRPGQLNGHPVWTHMQVPIVFTTSGR
jgi:TonB family protein